MKTTPQTTLVLDALKRLGHATNQEIYVAVQGELPGISVTSVHRITTRLVDEGVIGQAPVGDGVAMLDIRPDPHHHFVCQTCGRVKDIVLPPGTVSAIQSQLPAEIIDGGLAVHGSCKRCPETPITKENQ